MILFIVINFILCENQTMMELKKYWCPWVRMGTIFTREIAAEVIKFFNLSVPRLREALIRGWRLLKTAYLRTTQPNIICFAHNNSIGRTQ